MAGRLGKTCGRSWDERGVEQAGCGGGDGIRLGILFFGVKRKSELGSPDGESIGDVLSSGGGSTYSRVFLYQDTKLKRKRYTRLPLQVLLSASEEHVVLGTLPGLSHPSSGC